MPQAPQEQDKKFQDMLNQWKNPKSMSPNLAPSEPKPAEQTSSDASKMDTTNAAIKGGAALTEGFMGALAKQEQMTRQIQQDTGKAQAEAMNELNKNKMAQAINPLSTLISSYRSVL
jgi:hypothetical protein